MHTKAAILESLNQPLIIDEIEIPPLKPGQVLVEMKFSGVCHTQLLESRGKRGQDAFLPHLLGHEGSGVVKETGEKVEKVKVDDSVILSWMKGTGANVPSTIYKWKDKNVNAGAITTFSKYTVVSENRLTPLPSHIPMKEGALLGCALATGLGTVFNTAQPKPGQSLAVFGCGAIGLFAIRGAAIAGCAPVIAIDILQNKLDAAKEFGATHLINASEVDPVEEIKKLVSLDYAIEASGSPVAMQQAIQAIRIQGGCTVIIGNAPYGNILQLDPKEFNLGKKILGTWGGDNQPDQHFPRYCNLIQHNNLCLSSLTNHTYSLDEINQALNDLESGNCLRPIIDFSIA